MNEISSFLAEVRRNIERLGDKELQDLTRQWLIKTAAVRYTHNFSWMGLPIIQYPQDLMAMQELIWRVKPDVIVETGVARGGSLVFYASLLALLGGDRKVIGIDIDIRPHNRAAIEAHPMFPRIRLVEGSSVSTEVFEKVRKLVAGCRCPLVVLDSNHTHEHVFQELRLYSQLVRKGSYVAVFDTAIEDMPDDFFSDRPWGKGNNPKTAVQAFLKDNDRFEVDVDVSKKLLITVAPDGYLLCNKD
jgi:cephalosporin hydroxylase